GAQSVGAEVPLDIFDGTRKGEPEFLVLSIRNTDEWIGLRIAYLPDAINVQPVGYSQPGLGVVLRRVLHRAIRGSLRSVPGDGSACPGIVGADVQGGSAGRRGRRPGWGRPGRATWPGGTRCGGP